MGENNGHTMRTLIVVIGIFYTVLLSGSTVDALQLSEYSEVFSQYSDSLGNDAGNEIGMDRAFGISNISLVITYTTVVIAALMLAGFLWMAFAYSGQSSSGYGRRKRDAFNVNEDMAAKLHWINESFRRYEIEDLGCQLYIACEAGKIKGEKKSPKIGRITTMIHSMISPIELSEVDQLPKEVKRLFLAYQEGSMLDETCSSLYGAICPLITKS
jgi:hypothetical protein